MLNVVNRPYYDSKKLTKYHDEKKTYTMRTIDVRSTVIDFATSNGKHVVSNLGNKNNSLQRIF